MFADKRRQFMSDIWDEGDDQKYLIPPVIKIDTYKPAEMAEKVGLVGVTKSSLDTLTMLALSMLAGIFIALGTQLFIVVTHTATSNFGINQLIGGIAFTLSMVLVVITGAELFNGNCLVVMSFMAKKITGKALTRNLIIAFIGNFIGALTVVVWTYNSELWMMSSHLLGAKIVLMANDKVNTPLGVAFTRGVMGNALICLGVWMCYCGRSNIDKILALLWPISCLMACGFEHCVVNMWLIPMGIVLKENSAVLAAAEMVHGGMPDLSNLTFFKGFLIDNLCPVVLGNLFGGIVLIASTYWFVHLHPSKKYERRDKDERE
jgi:formate transporter